MFDYAWSTPLLSSTQAKQVLEKDTTFTNRELWTADQVCASERVGLKPEISFPACALRQISWWDLTSETNTFSNTCEREYPWRTHSPAVLQENADDGAAPSRSCIVTITSRNKRIKHVRVSTLTSKRWSLFNPLVHSRSLPILVLHAPDRRHQLFSDLPQLHTGKIPLASTHPSESLMSHVKVITVENRRSPLFGM